MYSGLNYPDLKKLGQRSHIGQFLMGNYNVSSLHYLLLSENLQRWVYFIVFISLDAEVIPQSQTELFDMQVLDISDKNKEQNQHTLSNFMIVWSVKSEVN